MYDYEARKIIGRLQHIAREFSNDTKENAEASMHSLICNTCSEAAYVLENLLNVRLRNAKDKHRAFYVERLW